VRTAAGARGLAPHDRRGRSGGRPWRNPRPSRHTPAPPPVPGGGRRGRLAAARRRVPPTRRGAHRSIDAVGPCAALAAPPLDAAGPEASPTGAIGTVSFTGGRGPPTAPGPAASPALLPGSTARHTRHPPRPSSPCRLDGGHGGGPIRCSPVHCPVSPITRPSGVRRKMGLPLGLKPSSLAVFASRCGASRSAICRSSPCSSSVN
jgi:hypothetical protein